MTECGTFLLYIGSVRLLQLLRTSTPWPTRLAVELVMLRHDVAVLRRQVARPACSRPSHRTVLAGLSRLLSVAHRDRFLVRPETFLSWHPGQVRRRRTCPPPTPWASGTPCRHGLGLIRLARENPTGGYRGAGYLGIKVAPSSLWEPFPGTASGPALSGRRLGLSTGLIRRLLSGLSVHSALPGLFSELFVSKSVSRHA